MPVNFCAVSCDKRDTDEPESSIIMGSMLTTYSYWMTSAYSEVIDKDNVM